MTTKLISITAKVILSMLLAATVGALVVVTVIPRAIHGAALTVLTGSMTPAIPVGSVVIVRPVDPGTLHVGDVITYQKQAGKKELITHRITAVHRDTTPVTLTTKGDANRGEDVDPVPVTSVRGRVLFDVPLLGTFRNAMGTGGNRLGVVVLGLIGYAVAQLIAGLRQRRADMEHTTSVAVTEEAKQPEPVAGTVRMQLAAVTLRVAEFDGFEPQLVADLLRADLIDEGEEEFTLAIARSPESLDEFVRLLDPFTPVAVVRSDVIAPRPCVSPAAASCLGAERVAA